MLDRACRTVAVLELIDRMLKSIQPTEALILIIVELLQERFMILLIDESLCDSIIAKLASLVQSKEK